MLRIHEFASLCRCNTYTLRYYDKIGILKPSVIDFNSGYRFYEDKQLNEYVKIRKFQKIGFSIEEIKKLNGLSNSEVIKEISKRVEEMHIQIEEAIALKREYESALECLGKTEVNS